MDYRIQGDTLTSLADAVRDKAGSTDAMTPADMVTAISALEAGPTMHIVDIGSADLDTISLDFSAYAAGDIILVVADQG